MSKVSIGCAVTVEEDGSHTITMFVSGLSQQEAAEAGPMLEEPCKAAVRLVTKHRQLPSTYEVDTRTGEKTPVKPETRQ